MEATDTERVWIKTCLKDFFVVAEEVMGEEEAVGVAADTPKILMAVKLLAAGILVTAATIGTIALDAVQGRIKVITVETITGEVDPAEDEGT